MEILFKDIKLFSPGHPHHGQPVCLLVKDGKIAALDTEAPPVSGMTFNAGGLAVSTGWFDLQAALNEPGLEHKEDVTSLCEAAAAGGFTDVAVQPNTRPAIQKRDGVAFVKNAASFTPVRLHSLAAVTRDTAGEELAEMVDLYHAGAVAFSDGLHPLCQSSVIARALQYLQHLDALLLNRADEPQLTANGQMHEGVTSTMLGMKGLPALAEEMAVKRDLALLEHFGGRLHFSTISTAAALELIRQAKQQGLAVTCDMAAHQLSFIDEDLASFDTNLKVLPPFRSRADAEALLQGLIDGTIDAVVSAHQPQDTESKELEFDLATAGISSIETAFASIYTATAGKLATEKLLSLFTTGPRQVLRMPVPELATGAKACLTIFNDNTEWQVTASDFRSKSKNSPLIGKTLNCRPLGVVNGTKNYFSEALKQKLIS